MENPKHDAVDNNDPMKQLCDERYHMLKKQIDRIEVYSRDISENVSRLSTIVEEHDDEIRGSRVGGGTGMRGEIQSMKVAIQQIKDKRINWTMVISGLIVSVIGATMSALIISIIFGVLRYGVEKA